MAANERWQRKYGDVIVNDPADWNNNLLALNALSENTATQLITGLVDFSVRVTLLEETAGLVWQPDALADMTMLVGGQWSPDGSVFAPDLKIETDAELLVTQALPMTAQWRYLTPAPGDVETVGRWQTVEPLRFHVKRNVPGGPAVAGVNFGVLPYFAQSVATEGDVFSLRVTCYSRLLWANSS